MATGNVKKKKSAAKGRKGGIAREAAVLITLALSVIFFIANFGVGGVVGEGISSFFFGLFGLVAYIFPLMLFGGAIFAISNKNNSVARIKIIAGVLVTVLLCALIQLISGAHASEWKFTQYYTECSAHKNGGGFFGGSVCKLFVTWFGTIGAYIIDIVLIIIGVVVISERSFIAGLKKGGRKVYDTTVKDVEQYRENAEEKRRIREENRLKRAADKVRGVTLDTEIVKEDADNAEDIHEIRAADAQESNKPEETGAAENDRSAKLERLDKLIKPEKARKEEVGEKNREPVFNFEKAAGAAEILPFDEDDRYVNARDISDYAIRHYEDEQSS
ncbi:MAG: DNA translocase FtsK 4TM domain-containing protein, partial [Butyrivibrio sp.]|nr:DNA translocase FtsK 4TM domain-containing protein [Butyrivibrio sp.]